MRVFKNFPDMDMDFQAPYGFIMAVLLFQMLISFFNYRSLLTSIIILYSTYITMLYRKNIRKYIRKKMASFRPVMAPYDTDYDEDDEGEEHKHSE
jgi:hypothetical protein